MKLERQSILGNTVAGYKVVDTAKSPNGTQKPNLPEVASDTPTNDVARILLRRLENESARVGARNMSEPR